MVNADRATIDGRCCSPLGPSALSNAAVDVDITRATDISLFLPPSLSISLCTTYDRIFTNKCLFTMLWKIFPLHILFPLVKIWLVQKWFKAFNNNLMFLRFIICFEPCIFLASDIIVIIQGYNLYEMTYLLITKLAFWH